MHTKYANYTDGELIRMTRSGTHSEMTEELSIRLQLAIDRAEAAEADVLVLKQMGQRFMATAH